MPVTGQAHVFQHPVQKTGTVQAKGPVCAAGVIPRRGHFHQRSPARVPADGAALAAPTVVDCAHQLTSCLHHGPALRGKIIRQPLEHLYHFFVRYAQVRQQAAEHVQLAQQLRQGIALVGRKRIGRPHIVRALGGDGDMQLLFRPRFGIGRGCLTLDTAMETPRFA